MRDLRGLDVDGYWGRRIHLSGLALSSFSQRLGCELKTGHFCRKTLNSPKIVPISWEAQARSLKHGGCAPAHSGKPPAFRPASFLFTRGYASTCREAEAEPPEFLEGLNGKPEAYRHVLRESRKSTSNTSG